MFLDEQIQRLEEETAMLDAVVRLTGAVLTELVRTKPAQPRLDPVQELLRTARERAAAGDTASAQKLLEQIGEALALARQLLAVSDLGVVDPAEIKAWHTRRSAAIDAGVSSLTVGHTDIWAYPAE